VLDTNFSQSAHLQNRKSVTWHARSRRRFQE